MTVAIIISISLVLAILIHYVCTGIYIIFAKLIKLNDNPAHPFIAYAFTVIAFISYAVAYLSIIPQAIGTAINMPSTAAYWMISLLGFSAIICCYVNWDISSFKALPVLSNDRLVKMKKITVYLGIMAFCFNYGNNQIQNIFFDIPKDEYLAIVNSSIILMAIALDRILNQIVSLKADFDNSSAKSNTSDCSDNTLSPT